ncbi:hypothetical protein JHW43_001135 [Diplocarpon mali]|nr:hypothetical protein JHW43_001135 [Diplocarpon mali]
MSRYQRPQGHRGGKGRLSFVSRGSLVCCSAWRFSSPPLGTLVSVPLLRFGTMPKRGVRDEATSSLCPCVRAGGPPASAAKVGHIASEPGAGAGSREAIGQGVKRLFRELCAPASDEPQGYAAAVCLTCGTEPSTAIATTSQLTVSRELLRREPEGVRPVHRAQGVEGDAGLSWCAGWDGMGASWPIPGATLADSIHISDEMEAGTISGRVALDLR